MGVAGDVGHNWLYLKVLSREPHVRQWIDKTRYPPWAIPEEDAQDWLIADSATGGPVLALVVR